MGVRAVCCKEEKQSLGEQLDMLAPTQSLSPPEIGMPDHRFPSTPPAAPSPNGSESVPMGHAFDSNGMGLQPGFLAMASALLGGRGCTLARCLAIPLPR